MFCERTSPFIVAIFLFFCNLEVFFMFIFQLSFPKLL
jgi:hypothetical protein